MLKKNTQVSRDQDVYRYFCEAESPSIFKPLYQVPHSIDLVPLDVVDNPSFPAGHLFEHGRQIGDIDIVAQDVFDPITW